ncbi:hypothetical protein, partial [Thiolapillus sp.]|uniref:hypothetical protein n=1 Tax=Thiolapillus sp. TaxID=2017437 RepID=UPI003AF59791
HQGAGIQVCLRPRERFWDIPVPKIDSAFDNLLVPQPSWSPSTTQQLRKLVAAPYLSPNDWTPRLDAYFASPLALCARRVSSAASRLLGSTSLRFALHGWQRTKMGQLDGLHHTTEFHLFVAPVKLRRITGREHQGHKGLGQCGTGLFPALHKTLYAVVSPGIARALKVLKQTAGGKRVFGLVKDFGTSQSPKSTRPLTTYWCPSRPGHQALRNNFASSLLLRT